MIDMLLCPAQSVSLRLVRAGKFACLRVSWRAWAELICPPPEDSDTVNVSSLVDVNLIVGEAVTGAPTVD